VKLEKFIRRAFPVEGVRVTAENMEEVATWTGGTIHTKPASKSHPEAKYIHIDVVQPRNVGQTMAFIGNWVLQLGTGFKIYTDTAFKNTFDPAN
jgi:hypothetical protein